MGEETKSAARAVPSAEHRDRVLIVEDEENARKGYEALLQRWGCDVLGVGSAEDALAKFSAYQPDALIADVELPGMNGLDLIKQLGADLQGVPAIVITGKGNEERVVAAIEAGAFWYIEKPLKGPVLGLCWTARLARLATRGTSPRSSGSFAMPDTSANSWAGPNRCRK